MTAPVAVVLCDATLVFGSLAQALRERWRFYGALAATWLILAVSAFRRAVEMNPRDAGAQRNLAIALEDQAHAHAR